MATAPPAVPPVADASHVVVHGLVPAEGLCHLGELPTAGPGSWLGACRRCGADAERMSAWRCILTTSCCKSLVTRVARHALGARRTLFCTCAGHLVCAMAQVLLEGLCDRGRHDARISPPRFASSGDSSEMPQRPDLASYLGTEPGATRPGLGAEMASGTEVGPAAPRGSVGRPRTH